MVRTEIQKSLFTRMTMITFGRDALLLLLMFSALCPVRTSDDSLRESSERLSSSEDRSSSDPSSNTIQRGSKTRADNNLYENVVGFDIPHPQVKPNKYERNVVKSSSPTDPSSSAENRPSVNAIPRGSSGRRNQSKKPLCLTCAANQHNQMLEDTIPEQNLRQLRLEMIKNQILKKLRLDNPPIISGIPRDQMILPPPVVFGDTLNSHSKEAAEKDDASGDFEDFYGKTEQLIVFSESVLPNCDHFVKHSNTEPSSCFVFKSPKEIELEQVSKVELWFHNSLNTNDFTTNQTFWAYELFLNGGNDIHRKAKELGTQAYERQRPGWLSLDITNSTSKWIRSRLMRDMGLMTPNVEHTVQIGCRNCGPMTEQSPVGTSREFRPFMVFSIAEVEKKRRKRRNEINCSKGTTDCCRERFVVNFKEIGWHWVTFPESYDAFFCKGSCSSSASIAVSENHRTTAQMDYVGAGRNRTHLAPCCAATRMSSIDIGYHPNNDTTIITQRLPNMVIESCGCRM